MASLPDSAGAVLESPALAHLVTLNPDGSPQVSIVWVGRNAAGLTCSCPPAGRR
jgi:hypothetical protein